MYVEPNTNIRILRQAPVDPEYNNTLLFQTDAQQTSFFMGLTKYNLANYTYQRVQKGVSRVGINAENMYDCNYMMFQNNAFGNKWFYAFIDNVEYVNNTTSEIRFTIDVLQTWRHFLDWEFNSVFVEREHSATDEIGDNIIPETLQTGELVFNNYGYLESVPGLSLDLHELAIVVAVVEVVGEEGEEHPVAKGTLYDGIYGGAQLFGYSASEDGVEGVNAIIDHYVDAPDSILAIYMCPKSLVPPTVLDTGEPIPYNFKQNPIECLIPAITKNDNLNGYHPKNAKLFTYPYNFYHVDNGSGNTLALRYEYFINLAPRLVVESELTQPVKVVCRPTNYKGVVTDFHQLNYKETLNTECISLDNYPMCSWNVDAWEAWVAQNSIPMVLGAGGRLAGMLGGVSAISSGGVGAVGGVAGGLISTATSILSQMYTASIHADLSKGSFNNGGVNCGNEKQNFFAGRCSVNAQQAKIIDDYFSMFGYATKEVKLPNLFTRPNWNYIKTIGCTIKGAIPSDDEREICRIFDKGITCWHNASTFGDYSQNNAPQ